MSNRLILAASGTGTVHHPTLVPVPVGPLLLTALRLPWTVVMRAAPVVLVLVGLVLLTVGAALVHPAAGYATAGVAFIIVGVAWQASQQPDVPRETSNTASSFMRDIT